MITHLHRPTSERRALATAASVEKTKEVAKSTVLRFGSVNYGSTNPSEMLAEAFTEWKLSPDPRPVATTVGKVMDKYFKGVAS